MLVIKSIKALQKEISKRRKQHHSIGFVPTMGSLHEGHLSLIKKARRENDVVILSIFVNPLQFSPNEDFLKYPRPVKKDKILAKKEKVDIIFYPSDEAMYKAGHSTIVEVESLSNVLCGKTRPNHFKGVTTVVLKLLNIVAPDILYLGRKDAQQAVIIGTMIRDLNMVVKLKVCPTIREKNGLALSSRNKYLNASQRKHATCLYQALMAAKQHIRDGERKTSKIKKIVRSKINIASSAKIEYIECVDLEQLKRVKTLKNKCMIALAVRIGRARLIDNIVLNIATK